MSRILLLLTTSTLLLLSLAPAIVSSSFLGFGSSSSSSSTQSQSPSSSSVGRLHDEWAHKASHDPCWRAAFLQLQSSCRAVQADKTLRSQLARHFMKCQLEMDGRHQDAAELGDPVPDKLYSIYVSFSQHTDVVCFHLQQELVDEARRATLEKLHHGSEAAAGQLEQLSTGLSATSAELQRTLQSSRQEAAESASAVASALNKVSDVSQSLRQSVDQQLAGTHAVSTSMAKLVEEHGHMEASHAAIRRAVALLSNDIDSAEKKIHSSLHTLYAAQRRTIGFVGSLDAVLFYGVVIVAILLVTAAVPGAAGARGPALVAGPLCSLLAERYALFGCLRILNLLGLAVNPRDVMAAHAAAATISRSSSSSASSFDHNEALLALLDPAPLRNVFVVVAILVILVGMFRFESPEMRQNRILQEMLETALSSPTRRRFPAEGSMSPPRPIRDPSVSGNGAVLAAGEDAPSPTVTEVARNGDVADDVADTEETPTKKKAPARGRSSEKKKRYDLVV